MRQAVAQFKKTQSAKASMIASDDENFAAGQSVACFQDFFEKFRGLVSLSPPAERGEVLKKSINPRKRNHGQE
jgi:hypothetical protein